MKKYIVGFLVGTIFAMSATAFADDIQSLVGKKVQAESTVEVNGKTLTTVVVEGKNYAPVRSIGEAAGYDVIVDGKKVILNSEVKTVDGVNALLNPSPTKEQIELALKMAQEKVERYAKAVETYEINLQKYSETEAKKNSNQLLLDAYKKDLADAQTKVTELQAKLAELEQSELNP